MKGCKEGNYTNCRKELEKAGSKGETLFRLYVKRHEPRSRRDKSGICLKETSPNSMCNNILTRAAMYETKTNDGVVALSKEVGDWIAVLDTLSETKEMEKVTK